LAVATSGADRSQWRRDESYFDDPIEFEQNPKPSRLQKVLGAVTILITAAFFINTTLAANISLTNGQSIQFGQGIQQVTACSGNTSLTITPTSTFSNSSGSGSYVLSSIKVTNIPNSCFGSDFILNVYTETGTTPLAIFGGTSTDAVIYNNAGTFQPGVGSTGMTVSSGSNQFTASFSVPFASSISISRITIQSTPHADVACALGGACIVGDTGPGGGKVFYVSLGGFACGVTRSSTCHYLEIAPTNWNGGTDPTRTWAQSTPVDYTNTSLILNQGLGYGSLNTKAIIDQGNSNPLTSAAALATSYTPVVNGTTVNDWFLPSENDLVELWSQRTAVGFTTSGGNYWSSSSVAQQNGRYFIFSGANLGNASGMTKNSTLYLRPARAF
jgi:hypothetical protein